MFQRPLLALYWSCIAVTRLMRYAFMTTYVANSSGEELDFEISILSSKSRQNCRRSAEQTLRGMDFSLDVQFSQRYGFDHR